LLLADLRNVGHIEGLALLVLVVDVRNQLGFEGGEREDGL
jgi:hypothetical protein